MQVWMLGSLEEEIRVEEVDNVGWGLGNDEGKWFV